MKRNKVLITLLVLLGLVTAGWFIFGTEQNYIDFDQLSNDAYYVPAYTNVYCALHYPIDSTFKLEGTQQTFSCGSGSGSGSVNAYVPGGCEYYPKVNLLAKVCNIKDDCSISIYERTASLILGIPANQVISISYGQKITFATTVLQSTSNNNIEVKADVYGLKWETPNGYAQWTENCNTNSLNLDYIPGELVGNVGDVINPNAQIINYISGAIQIIGSKDVINHNGKLVYIERAGYYYEMKMSVKGYQYADTLHPIQDSSIKCVPSTPYCKDDASGIIESPDGKSCGLFNGPSTDYYTVGNQRCQYECVDGNLHPINCYDIINCPPNKPYFNEVTKQCEIANVIIPIPENECAWYQDSYNSIEKDYGAFYWRAIIPFVGPVETPVSGCKTSGWVYMLIAGTFIIIVIFLILKMPKASRRR